MGKLFNRQKSSAGISATNHKPRPRWDLTAKLGLVALLGMSGAVMLTTPLSAGIFGCNNCANHCTRCHVSPCSCTPVAPPPVIVPQTVMHTQTIMEPRSVTVPQTTYRDVVRTEYRAQTEIQQVPSTRYRTVAVDEGGWQQVWVSKVVQKTVPETVMEQRAVCKTVPYQYTQRVPETTYVTQTTMVPRVVQTPVSTCDPCRTGSVGSPVLGWNSYPAPTSTPYTAAAMPTYSNYPPMVSSLPSSSYGGYTSTLGRESEPLRSAINQPFDAPTSGPVPDPKFLDTPRPVAEGWSSVPTASSVSSQPTRVSSASGRFVPVPAGSSATRLR